MLIATIVMDGRFSREQYLHPQFPNKKKQVEGNCFIDAHRMRTQNAHPGAGVWHRTD